MLGDYFRGPALTRAMSVYTAAISIGAGLALIIGGAAIATVQPLDLPVVGHLEPWQVVFLYVGLPGLLVAILTWTMREPPRTRSRGRQRRGGRPAARRGAGAAARARRRVRPHDRRILRGQPAVERRDGLDPHLFHPSFRLDPG